MNYRGDKTIFWADLFGPDGGFRIKGVKKLGYVNSNFKKLYPDGYDYFSKQIDKRLRKMETKHGEKWYRRFHDEKWKSAEIDRLAKHDYHYDSKAMGHSWFFLKQLDTKFDQRGGKSESIFIDSQLPDNWDHKSGSEGPTIPEGAS